MNENVMNASVQEEGIDLRGIVHAIFDRILWIAGAVVLCMVLVFAYTKMTFVPMYTSNVTVYANNGKLENTSDVSLPTFYAEDFAKIAVESAVLNKAIEKVEAEQGMALNMSWKSLRANLAVTVEEESRVVYISVSNADGEVAQWLAAAVSDVAKETLNDAIGVELAKIITPATEANSPSGSGMVLKLIVAALVGLLLSCGVIIALHIIRDRVNSVEDVENTLGLTVLGVIPFQKKKAEEVIKAKGENV